MTTRAHTRIVTTPGAASVGDAVIQSQIEDEPGIIRGWYDGPRAEDVILWRAPDGQWRDFRRRGVWWVRVR